MGLFSRKRRPFDLAALGLPRREIGLDLPVSSERMTVHIHTSCDHIAETLAPMSPFLLDVQGRPTILVKLAGVPAEEAAGLARAVEAGLCLAVGGYRSCPTYPVFVLALFVYDDPAGNPMRFEGFRDLATADVQDFLVALDRSEGAGTVRLYDDSARLLATGDFALRMPPFRTTAFPYRTTRKDLDGLRTICRTGAAWYHEIPAARRDFDAAVDEYVATQPPL